MLNTVAALALAVLPYNGPRAADLIVRDKIPVAAECLATDVRQSLSPTGMVDAKITVRNRCLSTLDFDGDVVVELGTQGMALTQLGPTDGADIALSFPAKKGVQRDLCVSVSGRVAPRTIGPKDAVHFDEQTCVHLDY
jgi:hypothetical protein